MTGSNWVQLSGGSTNPWNIIRDDGTYTASYGDHVISDGGTVTLPSPQQGAAVAVSEIGNSSVTVDGGSAQVEQQSTLNTGNTNEDEVVFVSDGSNWYVASDLDNIIAIPDSVVEHFEESLYEDQNKTLSDYYSGDVGSFTRQTSTVYGGTYALETTSSNSEMYTTEDRLSIGTTYEIAYRPTATGGSHFKFFYEGTDSWYSIQFRQAGGGGSQVVNLLDAGSNLDSWNFGDDSYFGVWNRFEITVESDDSITVDMFDNSDTLVQTLTGTGAGYSTGGFAFDSYNGQTPLYDELREV